MMSQLHPIDDRSQIGAARRAAVDFADQLGFDEVGRGKVALSVTEAATNIVKHAGRGRVLLRALARERIGGLEVLALDRGPGITDIAASLQDGRSTTGTGGTGLGALSRVCDAFDLYSQPERGTAVRLEFWARSGERRADAVETGIVCVAKGGEPVSGDDCAFERDGHRVTVLVADGIGHGPEAAKAARAATDVLAAHPIAKPPELIGLCHEALAITRGAAIAVAQLDPGARIGSLAGVGNIVARVELDGAHRALVSHHGTVGHNVRRVQEFSFAFPPDALLVLHSDGLGSHWSLADYPGLAARHAGLIAGVLYRDHDRGNDDVTVVVIRSAESAGGSPA
jgi:anti-sigma regulatory factor (Ser/Thr protein kinase)